MNFIPVPGLFLAITDCIDHHGHRPRELTSSRIAGVQPWKGGAPFFQYLHEATRFDMRLGEVSRNVSQTVSRQRGSQHRVGPVESELSVDANLHLATALL